MTDKILPDMEMPKFLPKGMKKKAKMKKTKKNFVEGAIDTFTK